MDGQCDAGLRLLGPISFSGIDATLRRPLHSARGDIGCTPAVSLRLGLSDLDNPLPALLRILNAGRGSGIYADVRKDSDFDLLNITLALLP